MAIILVWHFFTSETSDLRSDYDDAAAAAAADYDDMAMIIIMAMMVMMMEVMMMMGSLALTSPVLCTEWLSGMRHIVKPQGPTS